MQDEPKEDDQRLFPLPGLAVKDSNKSDGERSFVNTERNATEYAEIDASLGNRLLKTMLMTRSIV